MKEENRIKIEFTGSQYTVLCSVADPDPVLFYPLDPGSGMEQWSDPDPG
jgi:hypothetical protein